MEEFGSFGLKGRLSPQALVGSCCIRREDNANSSTDLAYGYLRGVWEFLRDPIRAVPSCDVLNFKPGFWWLGLKIKLWLMRDQHHSGGIF